MLTGKTALITGSTSGIGLCIAEYFAQKGANIVLNSMGDATEIDATRSWPCRMDVFCATTSPTNRQPPQEDESWQHPKTFKSTRCGNDETPE